MKSDTEVGLSAYSINSGDFPNGIDNIGFIAGDDVISYGAINGEVANDGTINGDNSKKCGAIKVKREIGLLNAVTMTVGAIVGAGIFVTPKGVLQNAGSVGFALVVWVVVGLFSMVGAACYIELGTSIPKSGSDFAYLNKCFGGLPAFLYLWVTMLCVKPASIAISSLTFSNYVILLFLSDCAATPILTRIVAALPVCEYSLPDSSNGTGTPNYVQTMVCLIRFHYLYIHLIVCILTS